MNMRVAVATLIAAGALAGLASEAGAQMMGGGGMGFFSNGIGRGAGMMGAPANMQALASSWLTSLHRELQITGAQEAAWQSFANAVSAQADAMQAMRTQMSQVPTMNAPQRALLAEQLMGRRLDAATAMSQSLAALYAHLDSQQQAVMDDEFLAQCGALGLFGS